MPATLKHTAEACLAAARSALAAIVLPTALPGSAQAAAYTFTTIDVPGANLFTESQRGINGSIGGCFAV
jgi:hypothetical protein